MPHLSPRQAAAILILRRRRRDGGAWRVGADAPVVGHPALDAAKTVIAEARAGGTWPTGEPVTPWRSALALAADLAGRAGGDEAAMRPIGDMARILVAPGSKPFEDPQPNPETTQTAGGILVLAQPATSPYWEAVAKAAAYLDLRAATAVDARSLAAGITIAWRTLWGGLPTATWARHAAENVLAGKDPFEIPWGKIAIFGGVALGAVILVPKILDYVSGGGARAEAA